MGLKKLIMMLRLPTRSLKMMMRREKKMMRQPPPRARATRTSAGLSSVKYLTHEEGYRVDTIVKKTKDETGEFWRILTVDEDFCEMMNITLDGIAEKKSVKTATLCDNWIVHNHHLSSSFRLPN